jgi:hypothetical protein
MLTENVDITELSRPARKRPTTLTAADEAAPPAP